MNNSSYFNFHVTIMSITLHFLALYLSLHDVVLKTHLLLDIESYIKYLL